MPNPIDLTGRRFGRLTVETLSTRVYQSPGGKKARIWVCRCDCGNTVEVLQNALTATRNGTRSCGCARTDKAAAQGAARQHYKTCLVCGKTFVCPPSDKTITCSPQCRAERKRQLYTGRAVPREVVDRRLVTIAGREPTQAQQAAQRSATQAAQRSPVSGPFETNREAKHWVLKSPENVLYEFDNLNLFIREHPKFFPNPRSASTALSTAASCMTEETTPPSRRGREPSQYKGWQVLYRGLKKSKSEEE